MTLETIVEADLTWLGSAFERNVQIVISPNGTIEHVGILGEKASHRLQHRAIIPGFVNTHSHAFQRGLRGHGEMIREGTGSFWSWREAMYGLVGALSAERLYKLSLAAFREMLACGITAVGEFHYLHHDDSEAGFALDDIVLRAARDAGIRTVLLNVFYQMGGIGRPLAGAQRRFATLDPDAYWRQMDRLGERMDASLQSLGAVVHSVRAAAIGPLVEVHREAVRRGLVFHMHVEEQQQEIDDCRAAHGASPLELINAELDVDARMTAVHCTHSAPDALAQFCVRGGNICICPLTEANLGDGLANLAAVREAGGTICLGTDSNLRISMIEEMRWLEYGQRLAHHFRGAVRNPEGQVGAELMRIATEGGARALGLNAGRIEPGTLADFAAIDLTCSALAGCQPESLADAIIFGSGNECVADVCVGGRWQNTPESPRA